MGRDDVAINPLGFLGKPLQIGRRIVDFASGFGEGLALLGGQQYGQILAVLLHQLKPATQESGTLLGRFGPPGREGRFRSLDRPPGFGNAHLRDATETLAAGRVADFDGLTVIGIAPFAIDVALLAKEGRVIESVHDSGSPFRQEVMGVPIDKPQMFCRVTG